MIKSRMAKIRGKLPHDDARLIRWQHSLDNRFRTPYLRPECRL